MIIANVIFAKKLESRQFSRAGLLANGRKIARFADVTGQIIGVIIGVVIPVFILLAANLMT